MQTHLAHVPIFRALPTGQLAQLAERCELRRFRKGQTLFQEHRNADSVWLIRRGWVYLIKRTPVGTQATIYTVTPEDGLCGFSAVVGEEPYFASAVAATDTTAIRVPRTEFAQLLKQQPEVAGALLAVYHTRMRHMAEAISLAQAPVELRLAYVLLRLRATFGKTVPVTHHELSRMAGTRWETSIRTLSSMKRRGWITSSRGKVTVVAPQKLRALLETRTPS